MLSLQRYQTPVIPELGWVKEWINRSQGLPLDLYLDFDTISGISPAISYPFMETILGFSHQIRLLNLEGHIAFFLPLFSLPRSSLPQLEEVYLEISSFSLVLRKSRHSWEHPSYNVLNSLRKTLIPF
ncbi:hypothetical protein BT96DRAFT_153224 [Gymnopus androsaceus JB14]|uniref:F-box domain-containing protein n=1 Tax=Gymnopus androsaceus JB14 TaxID=1447944 RepID=A0A6A4I9G0_9AGAR|nr:hypothetical protein BT96DRAFT_153224 [Gymnopus androsaceus JB14]